MWCCLWLRHGPASTVIFGGGGQWEGGPTSLLVSGAVAEWLVGESTAPAGLSVFEDTASSDQDA